MRTRPPRSGTVVFTGRRARVLVSGGVLTLALAGCTTDTGGQAFPDEPALASATRGAKASALPPRPAELSLQGVDPCALLTDPQLDQLKINSKPRAAAEPIDGPTCVFDSDAAQPFHGYYVRTVTADVEEWFTGKRRKNSMTTEPTAVGGFPAIENHRDGGTPGDCETLVGVARGQTLAVRAVAITAGGFTMPQLCEMSARAADSALQTLKARN
ncbi:DUF3558 domain-containing protein [Amycolatopsis sp. QT-25]|uniref:DUF3558 domain-containing protein n=1 Tax=Amycolatopsis sp. QT-25 TaxID=3034022 RepID=UPI0023EAD93A|nr:DUF3558 domain-containing protein [Amycolatopsis sp. QT-25]WET79419.1 DUF3558 domain-containing protein [Amycolatopsis sp. QT-25]